MRIAIVTDAWHPQVNGVVRTLTSVCEQLTDWGHEVLVISPEKFFSVPCPTYPEIRLALAASATVGEMLAEFAPDSVHLSTEGPLCIAARHWCIRGQWSFTTAYHTQFPDYIASRAHISPRFIWPFIRRFHSASAHVMVSTEGVARQLRENGINHIVPWSRGVDLQTFRPDIPPPSLYDELPRPIQLYVGRVAIEKNIEAFLKSGHSGSKVVVGDGPALDKLKQQYPDVHFAGRKSGAELAGYYAGADVFVFPSRTDTFGLVMIEALACGTPVAAFPVTGPADVLTGKSGAMDDNLGLAIAKALNLDRQNCLDHGRGFTWERSARQFLDGLVPVRSEADDNIIAA